MGSTGSGANIFPSWLRPQDPGTNPPAASFSATYNTNTGFIESAPYTLASGKFSIALKYTRGTGNSVFAVYNDARSGESLDTTWTAASTLVSPFNPAGTLKGTRTVADPTVVNRWVFLTYDGGGTNEIRVYDSRFVQAGATIVSANWAPFIATQDWYASVDGSIYVAIWANYLLTAENAIALERGFLP